MSTGALSQPQGNVVSPVGSMEMSVGRDVTPGGSFMMNSMAAHGHSGHEGGGADEHAGHDMASMEHGGSGSAGSEHAGHDMGSRRRGLLSQGGDGEETKGDSGTGKILLSDDPLDLSIDARPIGLSPGLRRLLVHQVGRREVRRPSRRKKCC